MARKPVGPETTPEGSGGAENRDPDVRRVCAWSATCARAGFDTAPGDAGRGVCLSWWLPCQLNEWLCRGGVNRAEIGDIRETDLNRIASRDVRGWLSWTRQREGEQHAVSGRDGLAGGQTHDRLATESPFDFRNPLFVRRVRVHRGFHTREGIPNDASPGMRRVPRFSLSRQVKRPRP